MIGFVTSTVYASYEQVYYYTVFISLELARDRVSPI